MAESRTNRRLAAILAADVVGYSRLMAGDEAGTLAALKHHREAVFDPAVALHNGRIVKLIGDGVLVEFPSVVDAVTCALAVQNAIAADGGHPGRTIVLRIGINLGDVIIDGDDIYGDGVNVAARLEPLAEPGGICIASIVNESVGNRIDTAFADGGEVQVKNIDRPIRIWKWRPGSAAAPESARPSAAATPKPASDTRSIAVLPFQNMSGDPEQEYFSDGITEDIITDLSKIAGLLVIARNSSFAYKGRRLDTRTVATELGVRSVLEGSIRRAGNRVRVTAQLIDAKSGGNLWAERYDGELTDIFAVQDEVTRQIIGALRVTLTASEEARLADNATTDAVAHDLFLRGRALLFGSNKSRAMFDQATGYFRQAIEREPGYAEAHAGLSIAYCFDYQNRWSDNPDHSLVEAAQIAEIAVRKGPRDVLPHFAASIAAALRKDYVRWQDEAEAALAVNPNFAPAVSILGSINIYKGDPLAAVPFLERAMRLDPGFSQQYMHFLGLAYLVAGKYETAVAIFRERVLLVPDTDASRVFLAAALGHLGQFEEARRVWKELLALKPKYSFVEHMGRQQFKDPADIARIAEGVVKAGIDSGWPVA